MVIHTFNTPGLAINSYLIADASTKKAVIIDPTRDVERYLEYVKQENLIIQDILETHVHADFVSGACDLKQACGGAPIIHCSGMGGAAWIPAYADQVVKEGDTLDYPSFRLTALHTPGHTYEHLTWLFYNKEQSSEVPSAAFTGDFIFVGSVGRPDLLGTKDTEKLSRLLYDSIFAKIAALPESVVLYPAHGAGSLCGKALGNKPTSTLGVERKTNPFMQYNTFAEWYFRLQEGISPAPKNFARIKKMNLKTTSESRIENTSPEVYIDIRQPEQFAASHVKGALNIPWGPSFCNWVGSVLYEDICVGLVGDSLSTLDMAAANLKLIGFDHIASSFLWERDEGLQTLDKVTENPIEVMLLYQKLRETHHDVYLIDVRTTAEWSSGHIHQAMHVELSDLANQLDRLPTGSSLYLVCGSGYRSSLAASFLKRMGYASVYSVTGGMNAWMRAGLPLISS